MILIDKPIPEDCDDCFCNDDNYRCGLLNEEFSLHLSGRLPNCPLREMEKADDLISRSKAIDAYSELYWIDERLLNFEKELDSVYDQINSLPSAQPEIIRCKDCRWGREACGNIECFADTNVPPEYHGYEWFCPNGERRTDG